MQRSTCKGTQFCRNHPDSSINWCPNEFFINILLLGAKNHGLQALRTPYFLLKNNMNKDILQTFCSLLKQFTLCQIKLFTDISTSLALGVNLFLLINGQADIRRETRNCYRSSSCVVYHALTIYFQHLWHWIIQVWDVVHVLIAENINCDSLPGFHIFESVNKARRLLTIMYIGFLANHRLKPPQNQPVFVYPCSLSISLIRSIYN